MKTVKRKRSQFIFIAFILISISLISFKIFDDGDDFEIAKSFDIYHNAVREIRLFYVDDADISKLINESTEELLQKLDPYTVYYPESKMEEFTFMTTGAYGGIGAMISVRENALMISNIYSDSPAAESDLKIGDRIIEINKIRISDKNISELRELLKGEPGSEISVKIERFNSENPIQKTIKREKIELANIPYSGIIDDGIAYIKLNQFKQNAANELKKKLDELSEISELKGLVLDLRGNPGGLLNEAVEIVSLFVEKGSDVVSTKGRIKDWNHVYKVKKDPVYKDLPLVVLMSSGSASASEIVAGAIQDLDRGIVIGQRSFGKGLVQITRKMNYNTRIKLTTAKYYIPSGRCIQAIDYSHRNIDGSVGHIPDSLLSEFTTKNGRTVIDGGGIYPDIFVKNDSLSNFTTNLITNYIIFDFATQFYYENSSIDNPETFSVTEMIYSQFSDYAKNSNITIESKSKSALNKLIETAVEEKFDDEIISKIKSINSDLEIDIDKALKIYKDQIVPILDINIISRYYYETGEIISYMKYDKELKEALKILKNKRQYNLLLSSETD